MSFFLLLCIFHSALLAISVSWTRSPFMALMFAVMLFINTSVVLLMLGFEFLALVNMLVYVGALAVLFLFVIMLLEIPSSELRAYNRGWSTLGLFGFLGITKGFFSLNGSLWSGDTSNSDFLFWSKSYKKDLTLAKASPTEIAEFLKSNGTNSTDQLNQGEAVDLLSNGSQFLNWENSSFFMGLNPGNQTEVFSTPTGGITVASFLPTLESLTFVGHAFYVRYADLLILNSLILTIALFGALVLAHTR